MAQSKNSAVQQWRRPTMAPVAASDFLPTRLSQFRLSDRVFRYDILLLILYVTTIRK